MALRDEGAYRGRRRLGGGAHAWPARPPTKPTSTRWRRCCTAEEEAVFADAGYTGADKRPEHAERDVSWNIAIKRSIIKALPEGAAGLGGAGRAGAWRSCAPRSSTPFTSSRTCSATKSALPRPGQEHRTALHPVRPGQPGDRQEGAAGSIAGLTTPAICLDPKNSSGSAPPARILYPQTVTNCAPAPQAMPRTHNRRPPQHCSAFP